MTTTSERLLQLADEHQQKAAALRLAAQELHEERTTTATQKLNGRLNAAVAARRAATGKTRNQRGRGAGIGKERRRAIIKDFLSDGITRTRNEIMTYLADRHQIRMGGNIIWLDLKDLGATKDPHVKHGYRLRASNNGHATPDRGQQTEGRRKVLLALLKQGPQPIKVLKKALNDAGYNIKRDRTRQFMVDHLPEAHVEGRALAARWMLGPANGTAKRTNGTKKPRVPGGFTAKIRAQREHSAAVLAQFSTTDPMSAPSDLKRGAIGVYIQRGYLRRKDDGFIRTAKPFSVEMK